MEKIIRSIDVGYGQTKFIKDSINGKYVCELFPSVAPTSTGDFLQNPYLQKYDVIKVEVGGVSRVVGKDAIHFQHALSTRILDDSYSGSDTYKLASYLRPSTSLILRM